MLTATGVIKDYPGAPRVLAGIDLTVPDGQFLAIMGPSGSGKSTLLHVLSGMEPPTAGTVELDGEELTALPDKKLAALRLRRLGFVFQQGLLARAESRGVIARRTDELLETMEVAGVADHLPSRVSGGQLQRASICRALVNGARTVMGDEPTGALNRAAAEQVLGLLGRVHRQGRSLVIVTHDAQVAARADRVLALVDGVVVTDLELGECPRDYGEEARAERVGAVAEAMAQLGV